MSILHNQLALYGYIDELVIAAKANENPARDARMLEIVEKLLPRTTGMGQAGWYRELTQFLNRDEVRAADVRNVEFPSVETAVAELGNLDRLRGLTTRTAPLPPGPGRGFEDTRPYNMDYDPALARAGYAAFVIEKIAAIDRSVEVADMGTVISTSISAFVGGVSTKSTLLAASLVNEIPNVNTRADFTRIADDIVGDTRFSKSALPCFGSLELVDGQYCSTVTTDSVDDDISVAQIRKIIEPINWNRLSLFFCTMTANGSDPNAAKWSRVREKVGAECSEYGLITDLVFYKVDDAATGSVYLNYDIDPQRSDPGYVEVDNGYIWVTPTNADNDPKKPGARIRTSKRERVNGLSPCATAALACLMGWGDAGRTMFAGTARDIMNGVELTPPPLVDFQPSPAVT